MFTKKRRQIPTWELAVMAAPFFAGIVRGGTPGLILAIGIVAIVGVYLIWTKL
jgi:lipopolysaccharide export LptBFGC system permease protein LptF